MDKFCCNCKFYKAGENEGADECQHPESQTRTDRSIRNSNITVTYYRCKAMLAGICKDHKFFEPSSLPQLVKESTQ